MTFDELVDGTLEEILIVEAKGHGAKLSTDAAKGAQMSQKWVKNTVDEMIASGDEEAVEVAEAIEKGLNTGKPKVRGIALEETTDGTIAKDVPCPPPHSGVYN